jgi:4'-phosphopantetheinyl transferase
LPSLSSPAWLPGPTPPRLTAGHVDVWRAPLDQPDDVRACLHDALSADERERAARFRFAHLARDFATARGLLRTILGAYLDRPPHALTFAYGRHGKPRLAIDADVEFNLAHSGRLALVAVACSQPVGIDVELKRPVPEVEFLAQRYLAPLEWTAIERLPPEEREAAFLMCWTRKEAYLKARGDGLAGGLDSAAILPAAEAMRVSIGGRDAPQWCVLDLCPDVDYVAAVAVSRTGRRQPRINRWQWVG